MGTESGVDCRDLVVRYGDTKAVDGLSFGARAGEVVAILGPNGAGKTSTVESLEGYRRPDSGTLRVLGFDPASDHGLLVRHMGVMLQRGGVYPVMGPRQVLGLFARYYRDPEEPEGLLEKMGLQHAARTPWRRLSGGEQQRLSIALALVGRPDVVFLDEPTAGVDPEGRLTIRKVVRDLASRGVCVILTTHELAEAEKLADRIVILRRGRGIASGTIAELAKEVPSEPVVRFGAEGGLDLGGMAAFVGVPAEEVCEVGPGEYEVSGGDAPARIAAITTWLSEQDIALGYLRVGRRDLEEIYLALTNASPDPVEATAGYEGRSRLRPGVWSQLRSRLRPGARRVLAQARAEIAMTLSRGESLLLTVGIPVILLLFFSEVHLLPTGTRHPVSFLAPGILALAVMGTSLVNLGIATGFERGYGVLKRLGATPLGRPALLAAKISAVLAVELVQAAVLVPVAYGLGWRPTAGGVGVAVVVVLLATAGFGGLGLVLAGVLKAEVNLAAANGLWLVLLLVSGMLAPLSKLPGWLASLSRVLPAAALSSALHDALGVRSAVPFWSWTVLAIWAVGTPVVAAFAFRWE